MKKDNVDKKITNQRETGDNDDERTGRSDKNLFEDTNRNV